MGTYVVFVRGVNVGGIVLKMEDFRKALEYIRFSNVRTYIQSGNAVFESSEGNKRKMEAEIAGEVKNIAGVAAAAIVLAKEELNRIVESHPLEGSGDPKNLYVTILANEPKKDDVDNLMGTMNEIDKHVVRSRVVYSFYGEGYGNSKRSNNFIEKMLKVKATTRNWNTMKRLNEMANE